MPNKTETRLDRRQLLSRGAATGLGVMTVGLIGCGGGGAGSAARTAIDQTILNAATTAEALATTMYYNLINVSGGVYQQLSGNAADQAYLVAAYEEELNHYQFLLTEGGASSIQTFFFPNNMFLDVQVTMSTLVALEDTFIAAYLIGVRDFSTDPLKVLAGQLLAIESEHRTLARVVANDLELSAVTGLSGSTERVGPPSYAANNLAYARTFSSVLPDIDHVLSALQPYTSVGGQGFSNIGFSLGTALASAPSAGQTQVNLADTGP